LNGKFASNLPTIKEVVKHYEGQFVDVTFQKQKKSRTKPQHKYYWAVIVPIFKNCIREEWGEIRSTEDIHTFLKDNCNFVSLEKPMEKEKKINV